MKDKIDIFSEDSYVKELNTKIKAKDPEGLIFENTIFYPGGGGQPADRGYIEDSDGNHFEVKMAKKKSNEIVHILSNMDNMNKLKVNQEIKIFIDWDYRYKLMKHHTALHILSAIVYNKYKAKVTGGTIHENKARLDFDLDEFNREIAEELLQDVNTAIQQNHPISITHISRDDLSNQPELIRTATNLIPESVKLIRLVQIGDIDIQADGGLHVKNTSEIGKVVLEKIDNKGKGRKRISINAVDS